MNFPRRRFLGSSLFLFGSTLMDALTTPLWQWRDPTLVKAATSNPVPSPVRFVDVAQQAGLKIPNVWGGIDHKRSIIEAKGSGLAFFDYDHDGWLDIYLTNGNRLDAHWPAGKAPMSLRSQDWALLVGRPVSASATTTMTDGTICFAPFGGVTYCFTTMEMEPS